MFIVFVTILVLTTIIVLGFGLKSTLHRSFFSHKPSLSCAYNAFNTSVKVMLDRSFDTSRDEIVASNISGIVARVF